VTVPSRTVLPRARDIVAASRRGDVTVVSTAETTLARIAAVDPTLEAFVAVDSPTRSSRVRASSMRWSPSARCMACRSR
jgi:Asp-tRNA(Asn)/Glu-tRNA(Gln) amidotransferase A subunit family amidase